jgi:hypothetical protein
MPPKRKQLSSSSTNNQLIPVLSQDILKLVVVIAVESQPNSEGKAWLSSLYVISKDFCAMLQQLHSTFETIFAYDDMIAANCLGKDIIHNIDYEDEGGVARVPEISENGTWKEGMYSVSGEQYPPINRLKVGRKYLDMKKDLELIMKKNLSGLINDNSDNPNYFIYIRKTPFRVKESDNLFDPIKEDVELSNVDLGNKEEEDNGGSQDEREALDIQLDNPQYPLYFWRYFLCISPGEERYSTMNKNKLQEIRQNYSEESDEKNKERVEMSKQISEVFEKHFPGRNFIYFSLYTLSEFEAYHFFIGEADEYFMGFWFYAGYYDR